MSVAEARETPQLVFWEVTKACPLACAHCRASAICHPLPGELTTDEGLSLIEQVASFGRPAPILVMTGGDVLMRADLDALLGAASRLGVRVALAPAVSPLLDERPIAALVDLGVRSVSISLDGTGDTHDQIRGVPGHCAKTVSTIAMLQRQGSRVQVNTVVMRRNVSELARVASLLVQAGVRVWEVFFLIEVGRGRELESLSALENEDVARFLYAASGYGLLVRTVEGPFVRRVGAELAAGASPAAATPVGERLLAELGRALGAPPHQGRIASFRTPTARGSSSWPTTARCFPPDSCRWRWDRCRSSHWWTSTEQARCCARFAHRSFMAPVGSLNTAISAVAREREPLRSSVIPWPPIPRACAQQAGSLRSRLVCARGSRPYEAKEPPHEAVALWESHGSGLWVGAGRDRLRPCVGELEARERRVRDIGGNGGVGLEVRGPA
jgi:MoaA/NifB/PqqE/SkfB family radical SAM enzyme